MRDNGCSNCDNRGKVVKEDMVDMTVLRQRW